MSKPTIDRTLCKGCGTCVERCPGGVFVLREGVFVVENENECIKCFQCYDMCDAIKWVSKYEGENDILQSYTSRTTR